jgi:hypothetical protein
MDIKLSNAKRLWESRMDTESGLQYWREIQRAGINDFMILFDAIHHDEYADETVYWPCDTWSHEKFYYEDRCIVRFIGHSNLALPIYYKVLWHDMEWKEAISCHA